MPSFDIMVKASEQNPPGSIYVTASKNTLLDAAYVHDTIPGILLVAHRVSLGLLYFLALLL